MKNCPKCGSFSISSSESIQTVFINGQNETRSKSEFNCMDCGYSQTIEDDNDSFALNSATSTETENPNPLNEEPITPSGDTTGSYNNYNMGKSIHPIAKLLFSLFFFALAIVTFYGFTYLDNLESKENRTYETLSEYLPVEALVINQKQVVVFDNPEVQITTKKNHLIKITYQYMVNGKYYTGDRYSVNNSHYSSILLIDHNKALNKYSIGKKITIYYNPDNPSISVISNEHKLEPIEFGVKAWLPAIFFICIGVLCFPGVFSSMERVFNRCNKR